MLQVATSAAGATSDARDACSGRVIVRRLSSSIQPLRDICTRSAAMALINIGNDPWLAEHESCERLHRDIMELLVARSKEATSSEQYGRISASVRLRLKQFNEELNQLGRKLQLDSVNLTPEEVERRSRLIEQLRSREIHVQRSFAGGADVAGTSSAASADRSELLGRGGLLDVNASASQATNQAVEQEQQRGLEQLSRIIGRHIQIAHSIHAEVDLHNEIIDDITESTECTDVRTRHQTDGVRTLHSKDRTCGYWLAILLLLAAIVAAAVVPA